MSSKKQINELKKIIKEDEKKIYNNLPSSDILSLVLVSLIAVAALSVSVYTYEDNKGKPSDAFTSIGITGNTGSPNEEVVAVGGTKLTLVAEAGLSITGTDADKKIEFFNTRSSGTGAPSNPVGSVQFNSSGAFGGDPSFKFDSTTKVVTVQGLSVSGGLCASGLTYPTSDGTLNQFLQTNGSGVLSFATAPTATEYGPSSGLTITGTCFSVVPGDGITVNTVGVCVNISSGKNLHFYGAQLGVSEILTGVSFQGNPIGVSYGGTGLATIGGTCQFLYSSDGNSYTNIGLCEGTSIGLDYNSNPGFITINYTGTGGGTDSGVSDLSGLNDAQNGGTSFTNSIMIGQKAPTSLISDAEKNTAIGISAIFNLTSGNNNTAIGFDAGKGITSGTSCTFIGASTGIKSNITGHNITCLGFGSQPSEPGVTNEITLGDNNIIALRCAGETLVSLSDGRDKTNIENTQFGLDFLNKLRPVDYTWNRRVLQPGDENHPKNGKRRTGFIAQELLEATGEDGNQILDLVYQSNPERIEARYGNLIPVLVKSIQDLNNKVNLLEQKIQTLQNL